MTNNLFTLIFFLSCRLVPDGVDTFDMITSRLDNQEEVMIHFEYVPEEERWDVYPEGKEDEKASLTLKGYTLKMSGPTETEIEVDALIDMDEPVDWASIEVIPIRSPVGGAEDLEGSITVERDLKQKRAYYWQEKGSLSQLGKFELRW